MIQEAPDGVDESPNAGEGAATDGPPAEASEQLWAGSSWRRSANGRLWWGSVNRERRHINGHGQGDGNGDSIREPEHSERGGGRDGISLT